MIINNAVTGRHGRLAAEPLPHPAGTSDIATATPKKSSV